MSTISTRYLHNNCYLFFLANLSFETKKDYPTNKGTDLNIRGIGAISNEIELDTIGMTSDVRVKRDKLEIT
jgi:hypothetical protein